MGLESTSTFKTLTDAATIAVDFSAAENNAFTLGGNRTLTFANPQVGVVYCLKVIQDASGSRLLTHIPHPRK